MTVKIQQKISVKLDLEFSSLEEFFEEYRAQFDISRKSKVREAFSDFLYVDQKDYIDQYEDFKKKSDGTNEAIKGK